MTVGLGSGKTRAHHFILALEQTAFGGSEISTTGKFHKGPGWLSAKLGRNSWFGLGFVQDQAMACGANLCHHLFLSPVKYE